MYRILKISVNGRLSANQRVALQLTPVHLKSHRATITVFFCFLRETVDHTCRLLPITKVTNKINTFKPPLFYKHVCNVP